MNRIFLIVLDSCGAGAMPDADRFGDAGCHTLGSIYRDPAFCAENLRRLGLGNIDGLAFLGPVSQPTGTFARMTEASMGKDTTIGHWEIAGLISPNPLPVYPQGFPPQVLEAFQAATGRGVLCNRPYSGTQVIQDYGPEQLATGKWIVYTSADSVFQIAAHESYIPLEELYDACRKARRILQGVHGVGRVIARPYIGTATEGFTRTANRHDFSLEPPGITLLDAVKSTGQDVISVGKIYDIFAHRGMTEQVYTKNNDDGMAQTMAYAQKDFHGLCFVNLVDFDMVYGHRNNVPGYAGAVAAFDQWLPAFLSQLHSGDVVMITADHGCDPGDISTDHTREYTPLLVYGPEVRPVNLGTRGTFADIAATCAELLGVALETPGQSFARDILR